MAGAPTFKWTEEIEDQILDEIMSGRVPADFLGPSRDDSLPGVNTLYKRLRDDDTFAKKYARAKEFQAETEFDAILEIADNASNDWMEKNDPDNPGWQLNHDHIQRSKLRVDARKWRASKMAPKKYGDKVELEHSGKIEGAPVVNVYLPANGRDQSADG